jgi:predicted ester cyclase
VCEMWMSGTHTGSGPDFEATGRHFRCRSAIIFSFVGERLVGARAYYDTGTIARQLA